MVGTGTGTFLHSKNLILKLFQFCTYALIERKIFYSILKISNVFLFT